LCKKNAQPLYSRNKILKKTKGKKPYMKHIPIDEDICCNDVIQYIFDLNKLDIEIYQILKKIKKTRPQTLSKKLSRERSTIYRSLQKLNKVGLCTKKTNKIKTGGYYYTYEINNSEKIKKNLEHCIENWYKKMKDTLQEL